jgi:hypothetical protein
MNARTPIGTSPLQKHKEHYFMTDFDLDSVLKQIMEGIDVPAPGVDSPRVVAQVEKATLRVEEGARGKQATPAAPQARELVEHADDALSMTAPPDTTVVTGDDDAEGPGLGQHRASALSFPTFTTEDLAVQLDIRNFAVLCKLRVRKWVGRKRDKSAAKKAESDHGSVDGTYTAYKKLFAGTEDKLKAVNSVLDGARTRHYQMTLPWSTTGLDESGRRDGPRLLPNTLFMEYITEMGQAKQTMSQRFDELRQAYPQLLTEAKRNLGSAFIALDYPSADELEQMFALDFEFNPIPEGVDFKGLPAQQAARLAEALDKSKRACMENAMRDVWARMHDVVFKMAERLDDPKKLFHDTLVSNVQETADLLRHLNATKDSNIEAIRQRIETDLCQVDAKQLRENLSRRALVARLARDILSSMDSMASTS